MEKTVYVKDKRSSRRHILVGNCIAMALSGTAIGWMTGMNTSPLIKNLILSLMVVIITIMGLIAGFKLMVKVDPTSGISMESQPDEALKEIDENKSHIVKKTVRNYVSTVNLLPIGLFIFFMTIGAAVGVLTRTNELLGPYPALLNWRLGSNSDQGKQLRGSVYTIAYDPKLPPDSNLGRSQSGVLYNNLMPAGFCESNDTGRAMKVVLTDYLDDLLKLNSQDRSELQAMKLQLADSNWSTSITQIRTKLCSRKP